MSPQTYLEIAGHSPCLFIYEPKGSTLLVGWDTGFTLVRLQVALLYYFNGSGMNTNVKDLLGVVLK